MDAIAQKADEVFGVRELRPGQRELIEAVLAGHDALGILPTGGGKSLCFQLPSLFLAKPVVVVSPLISLSEDQTDKLERFQVEARRVDSTLRAHEIREALASLGQGRLELIYVTPERLQNPAFLGELAAAGCSLFVVDEAHCIAEWGHDFRPAYLHLRAAIEQLGRPPILALTATATRATEANIAQALALSSPRIVRTPSVRPNLHLSVQHCQTEDEKEERLLELLRAESGSALVYTSTIRAAKAVWTRLVELGFPAGLYHGELNAAVRDATQDAFMDGRYRIVVATKAFGMGIDKPDTRLVVHYQVPGSIESYYQEVGRAGRDGKPAKGVLLYWRGDVRVQKFFLATMHPREKEIRAFLGGAEVGKRARQVIAADVERVGRDAERLRALYERRRAEDRRRLDAMLRFSELRGCRTATVAGYFDGEAGAECSRCDICAERIRT